VFGETTAAGPVPNEPCTRDVTKGGGEAAAIGAAYSADRTRIRVHLPGSFVYPFPSGSDRPALPALADFPLLLPVRPAPSVSVSVPLPARPLCARTGTLSSSPALANIWGPLTPERANPPTAKQAIISLQRYASPRPGRHSSKRGNARITDESGEKSLARLRRRRGVTRSVKSPISFLVLASL